MQARENFVGGVRDVSDIPSIFGRDVAFLFEDGAFEQGRGQVEYPPFERRGSHFEKIIAQHQQAVHQLSNQGAALLGA